MEHNFQTQNLSAKKSFFLKVLKKLGELSSSGKIFDPDKILIIQTSFWKGFNLLSFLLMCQLTLLIDLSIP